MIYNKKIIQVGHMLYVPLPSAEARNLQLTKGSWVRLAVMLRSITIRPIEEERE